MSYNRDNAWQMVKAILRDEGYHGSALQHAGSVFFEVEALCDGWVTEPDGDAAMLSQRIEHKISVDVLDAMLKVRGFVRSINGIEVADGEAQ